MSIKKWAEIDVNSIELLEVEDADKQRVKSFVLKQKKQTKWKRLSLTAAIIIGITTATVLAFPTYIAQIPFVGSIMSYLKDDYNRFAEFEAFSNDIGLEQTSNGITVSIDKAIYDGRNITVSYVVETEEIVEDLRPSAGWFAVKGASLNIGGLDIKKVSDTRHVGYINYIPLFPNNEFPEVVQITMNPTYFYSHQQNFLVNGDWLFEFSLTKLDSDIKLINQIAMHEKVNVLIESLTFTDVSTIMSYEQILEPELLATWHTVFPTFYIVDDLGNVYMDGLELSGGGITINTNELSHKGVTTFGAVNKQATQLIIKPIAVKGLNDENKIELESITVDINN